jgi:cytochrome-b5 reductase
MHLKGIGVASCIMIKGPNDADGKVVAKPYTPTTLSEEKGHFELVVKVYPGGKVSGHLHGLKVSTKSIQLPNII